METIDFQRSFLMFRIDLSQKPAQTLSHKPPYELNNARIPLDCRCEITNKSSGAVYEYVLGANCKTEQVGADQGLFLQPNADFVPVLSRTQFMALKAYDVVNKGMMSYPPSLGAQLERQVTLVEEAFDDLKIDLKAVPGELLKTSEAIVEAVLSNQVLNARTHLETDRYTAIIEYPIKTMNANERDMVYQPDTGPVIFPDLSRDPNTLIDGFDLAFVAFNTPTWTEFILRVPTQITEGISVQHYSKNVRVEAKNEVISLG